MKSKAYEDETCTLHDILDVVKEGSVEYEVDENKSATYEGVTTFSNRLFSRKDKTTAQECKLSSFPNSKHKLLAQKAFRAGLVHTSENKVDYLKLHHGI